ncbi:MAG: hypothetical protein R2909_06340 [Gemmatimonadales bacterium]
MSPAATALWERTFEIPRKGLSCGIQIGYRTWLSVRNLVSIHSKWTGVLVTARIP